MTVRFRTQEELRAYTLEQIEEDWSECRGLNDHRVFWDNLTSGRGWFYACRNAGLRSSRDGATRLEDWLRTPTEARSAILHQFAHPNDKDNRRVAMARVHLACGLVACRAAGVSSQKDLEAMCAAAVLAATDLGVAWTFTVVEPPGLITSFDNVHWTTTATAEQKAESLFGAIARANAGKPIGLLRDLTCSILERENKDTPRVLTRRVARTGGPVLLVRDDGVVGSLTLELLSSGTGGFYPGPLMAFMVRSEDFRHQESDALEAALSSLSENRWRAMQAAHDIRWSLSIQQDLRDSKADYAMDLPIGGNSMGGAIALHIAKLLVENAAWDPRGE
jgi:hypothetical protein